MDMQSTDTATWETMHRATAQFEQFELLQQVTDVVAVLRAESDARPQAPRLDLPLAFTNTHTH